MERTVAIPWGSWGLISNQDIFAVIPVTVFIHSVFIGPYCEAHSFRYHYYKYHQPHLIGSVADGQSG